ncbi:MAG: carbon-nitrogen hydrolase family protein [Aestuariivita sp.]|nr:carbon-nitrogen hydrolase family protein [Aestuariivita sp.]
MLGALVQLTSSDDPESNLPLIRSFITDAAMKGAQFVLTPEIINCVTNSTGQKNIVLTKESDDKTLSSLQALSAELQIWLLIGSLALKTDDPDGRFANRSFLIDPKGRIIARYDKIHMFDVQISVEETYRESAAFRPGDRAVLAQTEFGAVGLSICYDLRFPHLYQKLALAGARILTVPAAFSSITGKAHWEPILRARAIETGCYIFAPAQTGDHNVKRGRPRQTYGHSLVISPWGEILLDAGVKPGVFCFEWQDYEIEKARGRVPSLTHICFFDGPDENIAQ